MRRDPGAWSRQPVVWLGALILAASIAGCIVMIVLASRFADPPIDSVGARTMNVPLRHSAEVAPPTRDAR